MPTGDAPRTADSVLAGVDLDGTVVAVTGASTGLGLETSRALAARGAEVVMAVRDPGRAEEAARSVGGNGHLVRLDLASLRQIREGATAVLARWPRIDVLVNNAGVMATPPSRTADGFELQLGTNHLGHFALTALLHPALGPESRIVNVSSRAHMIAPMGWEDPHRRAGGYDKWRVYGQSKTANILFTRGLAERGRTAYAVHPGMIGTGLYRHLDADEAAAIAPADGADVLTPAHGAATIVWAATAGDIPSGSYLADCAIAEAAPHATDPVEVDRLWSWSEEEVGIRFP